MVLDGGITLTGVVRPQYSTPDEATVDAGVAPAGRLRRSATRKPSRAAEGVSAVGDGEAPRVVRGHSSLGADPEVMGARSRDLDRRAGVGHRHPESVRQQTGHLDVELRVEQPAAVVVKALGLQQNTGRARSILPGDRRVRRAAHREGLGPMARRRLPDAMGRQVHRRPGGLVPGRSARRLWRARPSGRRMPPRSRPLTHTHVDVRPGVSARPRSVSLRRDTERRTTEACPPNRVLEQVRITMGAPSTAPVRGKPVGAQRPAGVRRLRRPARSTRRKDARSPRPDRPRWRRPASARRSRRAG